MRSLNLLYMIVFIKILVNYNLIPDDIDEKNISYSSQFLA